MVETDNTFDFYNIENGVETIDNTRSNHFVYTENVNALYANYQYTLKNFELQAGVRMENTQSEGDLRSEVSTEDKNVKRDYTDFYPSAGITFNLNQNHATSLVYSSRIDRPNYQELNPFENKLDELSFRKGNPFLNPQYSNKIELSHTYKYATTLSVGYSRTVIHSVRVTVSDNGSDTASDAVSQPASRTPSKVFTRRPVLLGLLGLPAVVGLAAVTAGCGTTLLPKPAAAPARGSRS